MKLLRTAALFVAAALASCGGGGSVPSGSPPANTSGGTLQNANLTLKFPVGSAPASAARRGPAYIPAAAANLGVIINSIDGNTVLPSFVPRSTTIPLTTAGAAPNCTVVATVETCVVTIPAPPGAVNYTFNIEDANGVVLSSFTETITIVAGQANTNIATVTLGAVVKTVSLAPLALAANTSTGAGAALTLSFLDPDGNPITGAASFSNAVTVTDADTSGATALSLDGGAPAASVTVQATTDTVALVYSGLAVGPFTVGWSGSGITPGSTPFAPALQAMTVSGTTACTSAVGCLPGDADYGAPAMLFEGTGAANVQTLTVAELGWSNAPYNRTFAVALDPVTCAGPVASLSPATPPGGSAFTVTPLAVGICKITVTDFSGGHTSVAWLSVTTGTLGADGASRRR